MTTTTHRMIQQMTWVAIYHRPTHDQVETLPEPWRTAVLKVLNERPGTSVCDFHGHDIGNRDNGAWQPTVFLQSLLDPDRIYALCDSLDCLHLSHDQEWEQI